MTDCQEIIHPHTRQITDPHYSSVHDLDLTGQTDPYLHDLGHVAWWEPNELYDLSHASWYGLDLLLIRIVQILHKIS